MSQTVKGSITEAWTNIVVGFGVNYLLNEFVFGALLGVVVSMRANLIYGAIMTGVSFLRSLIMRRIFNSLKFGNAPT